MNRPRTLRNYFTAERALYEALSAERPAAKTFLPRLDGWFKRTRKSWRSLDKKGVEVPEEFLKPYDIQKSAFLPADFETMVSRRETLIFKMVQVKYQIRAHNVLRELDRCATLFPEAMHPDKSYNILELSSGSCGGAEIAAYYGNNYQATDFIEGRGSVYAPIHEALGLSVIDFDGSTRPYPFETNSFDIVLCFQAIDAYGSEENYPQLIDEMLRIARDRVVLIFNPGKRARQEGLKNGYEELIRAPLDKRYDDIVHATCPSTGSPAMIIRPKAHA